MRPNRTEIRLEPRQEKGGFNITRGTLPSSWSRALQVEREFRSRKLQRSTIHLDLFSLSFSMTRSLRSMPRNLLDGHFSSAALNSSPEPTAKSATRLGDLLLEAAIIFLAIAGGVWNSSLLVIGVRLQVAEQRHGIEAIGQFRLFSMLCELGDRRPIRPVWNLQACKAPHPVHGVSSQLARF